MPATCDAVPYKVREAEVMLAIKYVEDPSGFPGAGGSSGAPGGTFTKRQKLGDLEIEYAQYNNNYGSSCDDCDQAPILKSFPWIEAVLGCWMYNLSSGAGFVMTRQCSVNTVNPDAAHSRAVEPDGLSSVLTLVCGLSRPVSPTNVARLVMPSAVDAINSVFRSWRIA